MPTKLTKLQQEVLDEMRKGAVAYYMPDLGHFGGDYWFLSTNHKRCTKQIQALVNLGLVKIVGERDKRKAVFVDTKGE